MMKILRIIFFYCLFWVVALIAGLGFSAENIGAHMAFTFLAPVVGVWLIERRISRRRKEQDGEKSSEPIVSEPTRISEPIISEATRISEPIVSEATRMFEAIQRDRSKLSQAIEIHRSALQKNFRIAVTKNDYGAIVRDDREIATEEFLESVGLWLEEMELRDARDYIQAVLDSIREEDAREGFDARRMPTNGLEFEEYVASGLQSFGWDAKVTQGSGDQGIDVIAAKDGLSLGIQCKLYTGSVGNKAIQEAYSGMKHFGLDKAAVLTNADFTRSAKELAASTGVLLLSPEDIPTLSERPELNS